MTEPEFDTQWRNTGSSTFVSPERQIAGANRMTDLIARAEATHDHLWVAVVSYLVVPPMTDGAILDAESILGSPGIGCYMCEEPWTPGLAHRRCTGDPA